MFGMLDYRAHKLYWVLTKPWFFFIWIINLALIGGAFLIGTEKFANPLVQLGAALLALEIMGGIFWAVTQSFFWCADRLFFFFIDVVPAEGRTKEEALAVLRGGDAIRHAAKLAEPSKWTWEDTETAVKNAFFLNRWIFEDQIRRNIEEIVNRGREFERENGSLQEKPYALKRICEEVGSRQSLAFRVMSNPYYFHMTLKYVIFAGLFVWHFSSNLLSNSPLLAPPCKNGAASCEPWERDWRQGDSLEHGSVVTKQGIIVRPDPGRTTPASPLTPHTSSSSSDR
jgi:hypothetical protein